MAAQRICQWRLGRSMPRQTRSAWLRRFRWNIRLHPVGRAQDKSCAIRREVVHAQRAWRHALRPASSLGRTLLGRDAAVETEVPAELAAQSFGAPALRAERGSRHVRPISIEVGQNGPDIPVGMQNHRQAGIAEHGEHPRQPRLDQFTPDSAGKEHAPLGAVIVAEVAAVHAKRDEALGQQRPECP